MRKKLLKNSCLLLLIFCSHTTFFAQSQTQLIKVGDQLYGEGDYYAASLWYKQAMDVDSSFLELRYKYAESLRMYNEYEKAEWYYFSIYKEDRARIYPLAPFWYSMMLKYNGNYNEAKKSFKRIKNIYKDKNGFHYQKVVQEIKSCEKAIEIHITVS
jgi:tetratricopeptide (TPR) repeat protein